MTTESTTSTAHGNDAALLRGQEFLTKLVRAMEMDVTVAAKRGEKTEDGEELKFDIDGPDAARIIGKRGMVLEAIQYLVTRIVHRIGEDRKHIMVDAEGYRARHEEQLSAMAKKLAADVAAKGKVITFDPMNARQRRVIHMAVKEVPGVRTESHGEGMDRRVQIMPENHPGGAPLPPPSRRDDGRGGRGRGGRGGDRGRSGGGRRFDGPRDGGGDNPQMVVEGSGSEES